MRSPGVDAAYTQLREQIALDLDDAGDLPANLYVHAGTQELIDRWVAAIDGTGQTIGTGHLAIGDRFSAAEVAEAVSLVNREMDLDLEAF